MKNSTDVPPPEADPSKSLPPSATGDTTAAGISVSPSAPQGRVVPELSVVVPMWNEEENVLPLAQRVFQALQNEGRTLELLMVDDSSTDGTWAHMVEAQQQDSRVRPLRLIRHAGQSAALWAGFTASRGSVIATLDGDLQNDPADFPKMLAALANADMVCGVRTRRMDDAMRRVSSRVARWARRTVLGVDFRDTGCNLRVFKRSVLPTLFPFDGLHRFMPILAHGAGAKVLEMPVEHHPRTAGRSKYGVWNRLGRGLLDLAMIAWYRKRQLVNLQTVEHPDAAKH